VLKKFLQFILIIPIFLLVFFLVNNDNEIEAITRSSDRLGLSGPAVGSDHEINFRLNKNISASGKIEIIFPTDFLFPADFGFDNLDFAVSDNASNGFVDRTLASSSSLFTDGAVMIESVENNKIVFNLNSSSGIDALKYLRIKIGNNATFQKTSTSTAKIINPANVGPYNIEMRTYDDNNSFLERSRVSVFIIRPVNMTNYVTKKRSGASPVGWLGYGTAETILSLYTNFRGICRYATATGTPFATMTNQFSYDASSTGEYYHTVLVGGLTSGGKYNFYVRCMDELGIANDYTECLYEVASTSPFTDASGTPILEQDCIDMPIIFSISSIEGSSGDYTGQGGANGEEGSSSGSKTSSGGGGSGGGGGGGIGGDFGPKTGKFLPFPPPPGKPGIILEGWGYNTGIVNVLQDGTQIGWTNSSVTGKFGVFIEELSRGIYTFGLWSPDAQGKKSPTYSTTFWIEQGTITTVKDIIIPPTIEYAPDSDTGINLFGYASPNSEIEIWVYPKKAGNIKDTEATKLKTKTNSTGRWAYSLSFSNLSDGDYNVKVRSSIANITNPSEFSEILLFTAKGGKKVEEVKDESGACPKADLNKDGKVNITDFSILLYHWGKSNACADQNASGSVDLVDFSIMMYYWTG